jgi:hypothetical protein
MKMIVRRKKRYGHEELTPEEEEDRYDQYIERSVERRMEERHEERSISQKYYIQANNKDEAKMIFKRRNPNMYIVDVDVNIPATKSVVGSYIIFYRPNEPSAKEWKMFEDITNQEREREEFTEPTDWRKE